MTTEMTLDKRTLKISVGVFVAIVLFTAGLAWDFAQKFEQQSNQLERNTQAINGIQSELGTVQELDVRLSIIETKLTNVEALLQEMRDENRDERQRQADRYDERTTG